MKKEQILDMIGDAPDEYVKDAGEHKKRRRLPRWSKWVSGIAAILVIVLMINTMSGIPLIVSAKSVSIASDSRKMERPKGGSDSAQFDAWRDQNAARDAIVGTAKAPISDFAALVSGELLSGVDGTNRVWSPINAYIALSMTAELAEGDTLAELLSFLNVEDVEALRSRISAVWETVYEDNNKEISVLANSLWIDKDLAYSQEKMDILAHDYYASVYQGDLGSDRTNRAITNWMRNKTGGLLKNRTGKVTLSENEQMLTMVSTIYFQSKWASEFNASANTQGAFHAVDGDVQVTYMNKKGYEMYYYWGADFGAVAMPLENGSSMWFILPDEGKTVNDVLSSGEYMSLISRPYKDTASHCKWMKVNLTVPQVDVSAGIDLKSGLQRAGLTKVFDWTQRGFASALESKTSTYPVYLAGINQDTRVKIDEKGIVAASYIELNFGAGAAEPPNEIIDFVLDRPFVFAVTKSRLPLFVGTVNKP